MLSLFVFFIHLKIIKLIIHMLWARARFDKYVIKKLNVMVYCLNFDLYLLMDSLNLR